MKRVRGNESYVSKLRSSNQERHGAQSSAASSSATSSSDAKATKKAKVSHASSSEPGTSTSAFKTPKTRTNSSKSKEKTPSSASSSKGGLPPINLDAAMQEKWPDRPALPAVDFRKDLLQPVDLKPNPVPRYKRVPVAKPELCADVADNIFEMCYQQELRHATNWDYMVCQPNLTWQMRSILVDWLVDVHFMMKLQGPTLWLTISLLDRALAKITVPRTKLQLVGVAALSLACKMEEITLPYPDDFTYITEDAYSNEELLNMELQILHVIHYEVHVPTGYHFLTRYLDLLHASDVTRQLAFYYAERNLQETTSLALPPSAFAAVCVYAALVQRDLHCEVMCSDLPTPDVEMEMDALLDKLRDHRMELATAAAAIKKEIKTEDGEDESMDLERIPDGSQIEDYMDEKQKKMSFLYDIPPWIEIDASIEIDDLEEIEKAKAKEQEDKMKLESEAEQEGQKEEDREKVSEEEDLSEYTPKTVTYEEVILQHYEARREHYAAATPRGAPTTYTAPCPRTAQPVGVSLWGLSLTTRLHLPRTRENFPLHPSYGSSVTYGDCYRTQCEAAADSSNSDNADSDPPPLKSNFSRISRILAQLPPQPPTEAPQDVSDATIVAGVAKLLQELPANIDMNMLQYYAKLLIEHVGKEAVSPNRRHLNAARRKHSLASEAVPNLPLPFFTAQDPMVYMMLLGPTLHSTGTTFYTTNCGTAGLKLLCPNHFPIHTIEPVGGDDTVTKDLKSVSCGSSLDNVGKAEASSNVGSILAVSLNAANDGTIQSVAVRRSARHAGGRRYT